VCNWVCEQKSCPYTYTTCKIVKECRTKKVCHTVCKPVHYCETVKVAKCVKVCEPYTYTRCVAKVVCEEVPVNVCDPCASAGNGWAPRNGLFNGRLRNWLRGLRCHGGCNCAPACDSCGTAEPSCGC
ncbi:MAG: hypothetical protein ACK6DC_02735, partial [Planctomycetota bacterium]